MAGLVVADLEGEGLEERSQHCFGDVGAPEDWRAIVLGSGFRATVDQLGPQAAARVKHACLDRLARGRVRSIEANVIYARATR
ncbi:MAG: hypothetical protein ACYDAD_14675 [Acidimicrobiales bacterium]